MRLRTIAAVTAAAAGLAMAAAGTSSAAPAFESAKHLPKAHVAKTVVFHGSNHGGFTVSHTAPMAIAHSGIKGEKTTAAAGACGLINIGAPGSFGYQGAYAGQVEQMYDPCAGSSTFGQVIAHWQFADGFINSGYYNTPVSLAIGSAWGPTYWWDNIDRATAAGKDIWIYGPGHGAANPDAWRVGAEVNDCQWISWGTDHWYGGADWNGPLVTSGQGVFPGAPS